MAEVLGFAASIIAVVQLADRIVTACKYYIDTATDYPKDLRLIYVETGSLKLIFEGLSFLDQDDPAEWTKLEALLGEDGLLCRCKHSVQELSALFPATSPSTQPSRTTKKRKRLQLALADLAWPLKANRAKKLLDEIMRYKATIGTALQGQLLSDVRSVKTQLECLAVTLNSSQKWKVIEWLQGPGPQSTSSFELHQNAKRNYENGTGDWVFKCPEWNSWINGQERAIWLHGIPGAGKTILASYMAEHILNFCESKEKTACVYYYCYHGHNQDELMPLLRQLVSQLLQKLEEIPRPIWTAYERRLGHSDEFLLDALDEVLHSFNQVYVVVDALDESQNRDHLLALLEKFILEPRFRKMQVVATSRQYEDIRRKMIRISRPLSMSNPSVDVDIRLYVTAKIRQNTVFRRWPKDLHNEVENALCAGARGMFRWVVCQLDILRRLHHQSKIRQAIQSLPETLYETYERIFSDITIEEQDLLKHVLWWVCFHDFLWRGNAPLPARILLDSYNAIEEAKDELITVDSICDIETLKDVCGCLVGFSQSAEEEGGKRGIANIAHYTVREFLESSRNSDSRTAWAKISDSCYAAVLASFFRYALSSNTPLDYDLDVDDEYGPLHITSKSNLRDYCIASSVRSLTACEHFIDPKSAFQLLDSRGAHYEDFHRALDQFYNAADGGHITTTYQSIPFWSISLNEPRKSPDLLILLSLLNQGCFALAKVFLKDVNKMELIKEVVQGHWVVDKYDRLSHYCNEFEDNLLGVLISIRDFRKEHLDFLQQEFSCAVDYRDVLTKYMPGHCCQGDLHGNNGHHIACVLRDLLRLGAETDPRGFRVTPLQIAVYMGDLRGVEDLLEAGADPNNVGDRQGIAWDGKSFLSNYNKLHGVAPIDILYRFRPLRIHEIERLLLKHGAKSPMLPRIQWGSRGGSAYEET